jgi:hypothetical protein
MWNDSIVALVSCHACGMLQLPIHSTLPPYVYHGFQDIQWIKMHWGIWLPWCLFVVAPTKQDHDPVDKFLNTWFGPKRIILLSSTFANFLQYFVPVLCAHATNIKKTLAPNLTLLHGKMSSIEISSCISLIKCLWMSNKHEIKHAWMETNVLQNKHSLWQNMLCNKEWSITLFYFATKYAL